MTKKTGSGISNVLIPILYGIMAIGIVMLVCWSGQYPFGSETMNHIYWGDVVFDSIMDGDIFVWYDPNWYNGIEFFRHVSPLPSYFMAGCQWMAGGDPLDGYLMFVGLVFFISAISWFVIGRRRERAMMGAFLGVLWFFMPHNLYVLFFQGDLARAICIIIFPFFVSGVYDYLDKGKWTHLIKIMISFAAIAMCDIEYMIMIAIGTLLFMMIYAIMYRQWMRALQVIIGMVLAVGIIGVWFVSASVVSLGNTNIEHMGRYFQNILYSINPFERYESVNRYYYFGLATLILCVFGIICGKNKKAPGFLVAIIILISTSTSMYHVLKIIPGREYLMMGQYVSLALCFVIYMFLTWDTLKKPITIALSVLLILDVVPSLNLIYGTLNGVPVDERLADTQLTTLIGKAKEVSEQRIALLDGSELEAMGAYLVSNYEQGSAASMGGEWSYAATRSNIAQINRALTTGCYAYVFDRCKEMGNDTILIKVSQLNQTPVPEEQIDKAANASGYQLVESNEFYRLYDIDVTGNWGVVSDYPAIGIGTEAYVLSLGFPAVEEVKSNNLSDYTFEELSKYELVYLAGFTYDDKEKAEELLIRLSESGVKIVVLADGIPEDRDSHAREFLDVVCNDISFSNGYPLLDTKVGILDCAFFPQGNEEWNTVYVNGLDQVWGQVQENELLLDFYGTVKNDNIIVVSLNLTYYYAITQDESVGRLLSDITSITAGILPDREIVPLQIEYDNDLIKITSTEDNVNTTLAYHHMFDSEQYIDVENNFLYVNEGTTVIQMNYPYFIAGIVVSVTSLAACGVFLYFIRKKNILEDEKEEKEEKVEETIEEKVEESIEEKVEESIEEKIEEIKEV